MAGKSKKMVVIKGLKAIKTIKGAFNSKPKYDYEAMRRGEPVQTMYITPHTQSLVFSTLGIDRQDKIAVNDSGGLYVYNFSCVGKSRIAIDEALRLAKKGNGSILNATTAKLRNIGDLNVNDNGVIDVSEFPNYQNLDKSVKEVMSVNQYFDLIRRIENLTQNGSELSDPELSGF